MIHFKNMTEEVKESNNLSSKPWSSDSKRQSVRKKARTQSDSESGGEAL